jgi:YggT family protein
VSAAVNLIVQIISIYIVVLFARLVLDYVQMFARSWTPRGVVLVFAEAVYTLTDPPLRAVRRVVPPLRVGSVALDLSFMVVLAGLLLLSGVLRSFG